MTQALFGRRGRPELNITSLKVKLQTEVSALKERARFLGNLVLARVQGGLPGGSGAGVGTLKA